MRIRKNKKVRIVSFLFILMFLIGVGYAALLTSMSATGTAVLKNKSFNVYYSNIQTTAGSVTPTTAPTTSGQSTTELTWAVNMDTPGQFYEFTADVTNAGTVDAMIADVLNTTLTSEQAQYLTYTVTYEDYKPIEQNDKLAINETDSIRIRLEVKSDAQPADIPSNPQITLSLGNIYGIADSNAVARTKAVKYTVAFNKNHADATGTMADQVIVEDRATPLTANGFTREGYHFTNWNTAANGSGTSYTDEQAVTNIGNVTLYAQWAVNTYTIAFDKNHVDATGTTASKSMTYGVAENLTTNGFTRSGYTFKNWNTEANGSGTSYSDTESVNNLTSENGATVTLYAQWEEQVTKYAVQIYGINQDVDSSGNTLGLTFGPATGANYNNAYVTHEYEEIAENPGNYYVKIVTHNVTEGTQTENYLLKNGNTDETVLANRVTRTTAEKNKYDVNIHEMTWTQIRAVSDKTIFTDCMLCGDTKSVKLNLNNTIKDTIEANYTHIATGDGAGVLNTAINSNYLKWNNNPSNERNAGGYKTSRIRATLIGSIPNVTNTTVAGTDVLDESTCLYSCIESDLQNVITAKKIKYVTGTNYTAGDYSLNDDIADKIWLFSEKEMRSPATYSGNTAEGVGTSGIAYDKFVNTESKYYSVESESDSATNNNRKAWNEYGSVGRLWLRSPRLDRTYFVCHIHVEGRIGYDVAYYAAGLSFGFCIK